MKNNVFLLKLVKGELKIIPFPKLKHIQSPKQATTPKGWRRKNDI